MIIIDKLVRFTAALGPPKSYNSTTNKFKFTRLC